jgi:predicted porin
MQRQKLPGDAEGPADVRAPVQRALWPATWRLQRERYQVWPALLAAALAAAASPVQAVEYGPFTLTGFAKVEWVRGSNQCSDCAVFPLENKQRQWADALRYGSVYGTQDRTVTLFQPYLGARFDLGGGFRLTGQLSQRWRDGKEDVPGFLYERHVAVAHEDYGRLALGAMTSRSWGLANYPYGTQLGVAEAWASSGAAYGLLGHALRYTSRPLDVLDGDLVLEATYDAGNPGWKKNKPRFWEWYAQYRRGDLLLDAMVQDTRNGTPSAWGQTPFTGLTPFPEDDRKLGGSGQSMAMLMARYPMTRAVEVLGGVRANRWSGAYAAITRAEPGQPDRWNEMFNVDWGCAVDVPVRCSVPNPGYAARSTDYMGGLRYRTGAWTAHAGLVHFSQARTKNPSERGQSNSALIGTLGLNYDWGKGLQLYAQAGGVRYRHLGLSPMSMPSHAAFTHVDSRVATRGSWVGAGAQFIH